MRRMLLTALCMALCFLPVRPAAATTALTNKLAELGKEILKVTGDKPVTVGAISPTNLPGVNNDLGLEAMLREALNTVKPGVVADNAEFEVKGDYSYAKSAGNAGGLKVIKIKARVIRKEDSEDLLTIPLQVELSDTATVGRITQVTSSIPPDGSKAERNAKLEADQKNPQVHIHGPQRSLVSATPESLYAVELLVKPRNQANQAATPREVQEIKGQAFVDLQRGDLYEVKVYNRSSSHVAVSLSIDGLDMFHFSAATERTPQGKPKFTHVIIPPQQNDTIVGWFQKVAKPDNFLSFLVTELGKGAISQAGLTAKRDVGVLHLQFSKCSPLAPGGKSTGDNETGQGPPRTVDVKPVSFEIESPHEFVSIRYNRPN